MLHPSTKKWFDVWTNTFYFQPQYEDFTRQLKWCWQLVFNSEDYSHRIWREKRNWRGQSSFSRFDIDVCWWFFFYFKRFLWQLKMICHLQRCCRAQAVSYAGLDQAVHKIIAGQINQRAIELQVNHLTLHGTNNQRDDGKRYFFCILYLYLNERSA